MSPTPFLDTASTSTLSTYAPLTTLDPGSPHQAGPMASQYILGTGGFLFAVVGIASVARYFCRGRGIANTAKKTSLWASLLSAVRTRSTATVPTAATTDWPVDLENGPIHINMIYAKFFHPAFWNPVERHPPTAFAPAILVEEEALEVPTTSSRPFGLNLFLSTDEGGKGAKGSTTPSRENSKNDIKDRVKHVPPYDTSSPTNVTFVSKIIGTTIRPGGFLYVPSQDEDDLSDGSDLGADFDFGSLAYDGIATTPLTSPPISRRHGMADMGHLLENLNDTLANEPEGMVSTVSFPAGLANIWEHVLSGMPPHGLENLEDSTFDDSLETCTTIGSMPSIPSFDSCDDFEAPWSDVDTLGRSHPSVDSMWRLYDHRWIAMGDTLDSDTNTSAISHDAQYGGSDAELVEHCTPLQLLDTKDNDPIASRYINAGVRNRYYMRSSLSKRQADIQRDPESDTDSYGSHDSIQGDLDDTESREGPDEIEGLMSEIYVECLWSANDDPMAFDREILAYDGQNDMGWTFRSSSLDAQETTVQIGSSMVQSILSNSMTLGHDAGFYEGYNSYLDSSTEINTMGIHPEYIYWSKPIDVETMASKHNIVHDNCGDMRLDTCDTEALKAPHEGPDLVRKILAGLRDPSLDIVARDISEDSDSDEEEEGVVVLCNSMRNSLESSYCKPNSDVSDGRPIYPLTPSPVSAVSNVKALNVLEDRMFSPNAPGLPRGAQVVPLLTMLSPPALPREACSPDSWDLSDDTRCDHEIPGLKPLRPGIGRRLTNKGSTYPLATLFSR